MSPDGSGHDDSAERPSPTSYGGRRKFMKATTVGLGTLLAGYSADSASAQNETNGTTTGDQGQDFSGVTIDYWDVMNVQSQVARERVQEFIRQFESDTGATVQLNLSGYQQMSGQQWVQAWQNEEYPVAFNHEDFYFGRIIPTGHLKPFDEYRDQLDDEALDGMQWAMDLKQQAYRFWDIQGESGIINFPHATGIRNNMTVRTDLLDQAGYSLDDIPDTGDAVQDWEQTMQMAQDVQENSDAQWGFHGHATWPDYNDNTAPWMSAQDAQGSRYISEDGTEAYPSDLWTPWLQRYADMIHEYGVSGPQTPAISDEEVANMMYAGDVAMSTVEPLNYPTFIRRAPDLLENGSLQMTPYPDGNSGAPGHVGFHDSGVNRQPSNADAQRWERQLEVGYALLNRLLSEDFQTDYPNMVGWMGIRQNLWEQTTPQYNEQSGFKNAVVSMLEDAEITWPYHRFSNAIIFRTIAPYIQNALRQQITPEEAMSQARQESNADIQTANDELGEPGTWPVE